MILKGSDIKLKCLHVTVQPSSSIGYSTAPHDVVEDRTHDVAHNVVEDSTYDDDHADDSESFDVCDFISMFT